MIIKHSEGNNKRVVTVKLEPKEFQYLIVSECGLYPQDMNRFRFWQNVIATYEDMLSTTMFFTGTNWWIFTAVSDARIAKLMGGFRMYLDPVANMLRLQRFSLTTKLGFSCWRWVETGANCMDKPLAQTYDMIDAMDDDEIAAINNANGTTAESLLCDEEMK